MSQLDVFIEGSFKTVTPLTYSLPTDESKSGCLPRIGDKLYLPASAIRGKLRRLAIQTLVEEVGKLNFKDYYYLTLGGLKDGGVVDKSESGKEQYAVSVMQWIKKNNPLITLFGAMTPVATPGRLSVSHAIAHNAIDTSNTYKTRDLAKVDKICPVRVDDARQRPSEMLELVDDEFLDAYLERTDEARVTSSAKKKEKALKTQLYELKKSKASEEDIAAVSEQLKEVNEELKSSKVTQIANISLAFEAIPADEDMRFSMRIMNASEVEVSLLMKAIQRLSYNPVFGGRNAVGNGLVAGNFVMSTRPAGKLVPPTMSGKFSWEGDFAGATFEGFAKEMVEAKLPFDELDFNYESIIKLINKTERVNDDQAA